MSDKDKDLPNHLTKGGPGDKFLGAGKVDTSKWFERVDILENQIKDQEIWFCSAPFQQLYTNTKGEWGPCSWAQEDPKGPNIYNTSMEEWFVNNPRLNQLRNEMITPNSDLTVAKTWCQACMKQEATYGRSRRQSSLKIQTNDRGLWLPLRMAVERFKRRGKGSINNRIFEVQIKAFGNECNLDCYMCQPYDSSTRTKTMNDLKMSGQTVFDEHALKNGRELKSIKGETLESMIDQVVKIAPYIYNLKLIGGEPLVMKQFYQLLDRIVKTGEAKHIKVKYQTNMSVLNLEKIKITNFIPEFDLFEFTVSLDSMGKANNYIRRRSNWDDIVNNIKTVSEYPNVKINVNGTISFLSVLRFYELIDWYNNNVEMFGRDTQINWSQIRGPKKLCANVLPRELKEKLIPIYDGFPDIQNVLKESSGKLDYQDTLDYLIQIDNYYKGTKWEMNLFDVFPELQEFYNSTDSGATQVLKNESN